MNNDCLRQPVESSDVLAEERIQQLATKTAYKVGHEFFVEVATAIAEILDVSHVLLTECLDGQSKRRVRTLAFYSLGRICNNIEYDIDGTPCENVLDQGIYFCPNDVCPKFPDDDDLIALEAESYGGIRLQDSKDNTVGHLCYINQTEVRDATWQLPALKLIKARCGAEIERLKQERIQIAQVKLVEETNRLASLGTLAAGIAHEINNPLTTLQLAAELALQEAEENAAMPTENIQSILESVKSISQIVDGVLRASSNQDTAKIPCDLASLVQKACDLTNHVAEKRSVSVECPDLSPSMVMGNPLELQQVFVNLISNAIHASDDPGKPVGVSISSDSTRHVVVVSNFGAAIPQQEQGRVFEPFYTTRKSKGGTGLGLSVSLGIARAHDGDITLESTSQETRFSFAIPVHDGRHA